MRVSLLQMNSRDDLRQNMRQAEELAGAAAAADRPDLMLLPEYWSYLGDSEDRRRAIAEVLPVPGRPGGPAYELLRRLARGHRVILHGGSMVERDGQQLYNTSVVFDREGAEIARYRKIHRFDVVTPDGQDYRESRSIGRGEAIVTYEADGLRVGCSICYDLRFAELYLALARRGAQLIMIPAAFTLMTGKDHWEVLVRARAIETQAYVLACGQTGTHPGPDGPRACYGHSMVADPWGHVIARASDGVGWVTARLDPALLARVRAAMPVHHHRVL